MSENGVSKIEDFRRAAEADRAKRAVAVVLPSGLRALLVRPTPTEIFLYVGQLPQNLAAAIPPAEGSSIDPEQVVSLAHQTVEFVRFLFYWPRVPDEARPGRDILVSDVDWALRWGRGEIDAKGTDLAEFRQPGEPGPAAPSPGGGDVSSGPQRPPEAGHGGPAA